MSESSNQIVVEWDESMSLDAKDFGPYWLDGVQGSLSEERRNSTSRKVVLYNSQVKKARSFNRSKPLTLRDLLNNLRALDLKLSELWSLYPSLEIRFSINVSNLTKRSSKLLRCFLIYFYSHNSEFPKYINYEIELEFERILESEERNPISPQILQELRAIRYFYLTLGSPEADVLLEQLYSKENLERWIELGSKLVDGYRDLIQIPYIRLKPKVQRRGYRESHSNKRKSRDQRLEVAMSTEVRTIEEIKASILKKQALLFEKRLDSYLAMTDQDIPLSERREIFRSIVTESVPTRFDSDEELDEINRQLYSSSEREVK